MAMKGAVWCHGYWYGAFYLQHVEHAEVLQPSFLWVVHLRSLDDDRVRRKVDAPRQSGSAHEHLKQDKRKWWRLKL